MNGSAVTGTPHPPTPGARVRRTRTGARASAVACALAFAAACGAQSAAPTPGQPVAASGMRFTVLAEGLSQPLDVQSPPGDPRLFIVEQTGRIRVLDGGRLLPRPFLDVSADISTGHNEQGLLGLAFHPRFADNGWLFVNYTDRAGDTKVVRFTATRDRAGVESDSRRLILHVEQPYANHNGGCVRFGPDGKLWIGMGDGGSGGDPRGNGQNLRALLGKMLRIDVDGALPYRVPRDNPFVGRGDARPEVWAYGLRNPWRFAFDRPTGRLYIADVGQNRWEEVHVAPAARGGIDYGWNVLEGTECYRSKTCQSSSLRPVLTYGRDGGCSVTGGEVYRGREHPELAGHYFFSDYCTGWIRSFRWDGERVADYREWRGDRVPVSGFGTDAAGELLVLDHDGRLLRLGFEPRR